MDTRRSMACIADFVAFYCPDLKLSEREGILVLLSAHDHIWKDSGWSDIERLNACNLLFDKAMSFLYA
jgi:hypothetical protein